MKLEHKIVVKKAHWADDHPQGEIKLDTQGTQGIIIVAKDGWNYKEYDCRKGKNGYGGTTYGQSKGMQVRMSFNGPVKLTWPEWQRVNAYVEKVWQEVLQEHVRLGL